jgi:hypothetical protein
MNKYANYVEECLEILIERSKEKVEKAKKTKDEFDSGLAFGYYSILSLLLSQAEIFEIKNELKESIRNFNPYF